MHPDAATASGADGGPAQLRVALVDDAPAIAAALGVWLGPSAEIVAFRRIEDLTASAPLTVDVVLLDLNLNDARREDASALLAGIRGVREVVPLGPPVLVITSDGRPRVLAAALAAGAAGVLHKNEAPEVQVQAVRTVAAGGSVISPAVAGAVRRVLAGHPATLTDRQRNVLVMRVQGRSWAQIAKLLHVTEDTARDHLTAGIRKYQAFLADRSLAELVQELGVAPGDLAG